MNKDLTKDLAEDLAEDLAKDLAEAIRYLIMNLTITRVAEIAVEYVQIEVSI